VVNADDFGLTSGVCDGVLRAHADGIATSTSALVAAPAFDAHAPALRDSGMGVGLHLCVVGEDPPLLTAREIPTLVDRRGLLPLTWSSYLRRAATGRIDPSDLGRELGAQAGKLRTIGLRVDHVDAHQNLQLWPSFAAVAIDVAIDLGAPVLRVASSERWSPTGIGVRHLGSRVRRTAERAGLVVPDHAGGLDGAGHLAGPRLAEEIAALGRRGGHADLAVHPGLADDPDRRRYEWGYSWAAELDALCSATAVDAVRRAGFRLGTFDELAAAVTAG
jgi:predicted glycoside hydrolase/deacetylase ChbG (UPF0249 family)